MKNAIILHGTMGSPEGNWFKWLKNELEKLNYEVWLPELPNADQPSLSKWHDFIQDNCPFEINENTLIIGHSSGAILALIVTQLNKTKVGQVICVSAFHDNSLGWDANNKLFDVAFDWEKISKNCDDLLFIHSDNDPYVPLEQAQFVADKCGSKIVVIPGQGHFNLEHSESYKEFPKLLELMKTS